MQNSFKRILIGTIFFVLTIILAVVGYVFFGWTILEAIYMVVITIFGVGYGEVYSEANLLLIKHLNWITRVPLSIKAAQFYVIETPDSEFIKTDIQGYKAVEKAHPPRRGFRARKDGASRK